MPRTGNPKIRTTATEAARLKAFAKRRELAHLAGVARTWLALDPGAGPVTHRRIAAWLNGKGIRTSRGCAFTVDNVRRIVS